MREHRQAAGFPTITRRRLAWGTAAASIAWCLAVWHLTDRYYDEAARNAVAAAERQAEHDALSISDSMTRMLSMRRGIAVTLAEDETVRRATLQRMRAKRTGAPPVDTPELRALGRFLRAAEEHLKLDSLWVGDGDGIGFAALSADPRHSPIGVDYSDRLYFREAKAGRVGYQFAVGRTTGIGGIYFSAPIRDGDSFAGFVLAKTNIARLAVWAGPSQGVLSDAAGVVILASDRQYEMHQLPGATVDRLDEEARQAQYARNDFPMLDMAEWPDPRFPQLKKVAAQGKPAATHAVAIPEFGLLLTVMRPADELLALDRQHRLVFVSLAGIGMLLLIVAAVTTAYRVQGRSSRAALEHQRKQTEDRLRLAASVFDNANEGICITDADQRIVDVNPTLCKLTGFQHDELVGQTPRLFQSGRQDTAFYQAMWQTIGRDGHWHGELWNRRRDGDCYAVRLTVSAVRDSSGKVTHFIGIMVDITASKQHVAQLERVAHFDALTGLPNRLLLADRMRQAIAHTHRGDTFLAVCYLDLDEFKPINDHHGHESGDRVLMEVSRRLDACLRGGDTVARLGGDEFVLLLSGLHRREEYETTLLRVLDEMRAPLMIDGRSFCISASIGVALCPHHGTDADDLLRLADEAMYRAKQDGRNRWQLCVPCEASARGTRVPPGADTED